MTPTDKPESKAEGPATIVKSFDTNGDPVWKVDLCGSKNIGWTMPGEQHAAGLAKNINEACAVFYQPLVSQAALTEKMRNELIEVDHNSDIGHFYKCHVCGGIGLKESGINHNGKCVISEYDSLKGDVT